MFPAHLLSSIEASMRLRQPISKLLHALSPETKRVIITHDLMTSVVQVAASVFTYLREALGKPFPLGAEIPKELPSKEGCFTFEIMNFSAHQYEFVKIAVGDLYNTCRLTEGTYIDLQANELMNGDKRQWAIGPLNPTTMYRRKNSNSPDRCLEWLDKQAPHSVACILFGTSVSLLEKQIKELAIGLEQSAQKFIWVLRDADRGDISTGEVRRAKLPQGYEERMEEMGQGMVVGDWAPQLGILGHVATGGFMSHCEWNSCMENITMGVSIAAWPMHSDQPRNSMLLTQIVNVGLVVREWEHQEELVKSSKTEIALRRLITSKEGNDLRKSAVELGSAIRRSMEDGGACRMEFNSFIAHITR